jgi:hypothetical protein
MDNKKKGFRYMPHQSVSLALSAGIGIHLLEYGTFIPDEDGKVKKITWRGKRRMVVRCCHGRDPLGRIAGGS